jgi:hypothetical protein
MQRLLLDLILEKHSILEDSELLPAPRSRADLRGLVELSSIIITAEHHEDVAYVVYYFSCRWGNGFYVSTHKERLVAIGGTRVLTSPMLDPERPTPGRKIASPARRKAILIASRRGARKNPKPSQMDAENMVVLPAWAGFDPGDGGPLSRGRIEVSVDSDEYSEGWKPTLPQRRAYRYLLERADDLQAAMLAAVVSEYAKLRKAADGLFMKMPPSVDTRSLRDLLALSGAVIHDVELDGVAYVGYSFRCAWEQEHQLGILTHKARVAEIGDIDTAISPWSAVDDRRRQLRRGRVRYGRGGAIAEK